MLKSLLLLLLMTFLAGCVADLSDEEYRKVVDRQEEESLQRLLDLE